MAIYNLKLNVMLYVYNMICLGIVQDSQIIYIV